MSVTPNSVEERKEKHPPPCPNHPSGGPEVFTMKSHMFSLLVGEERTVKPESGSLMVCEGRERISCASRDDWMWHHAGASAPASHLPPSPPQLSLCPCVSLSLLTFKSILVWYI